MSSHVAAFNQWIRTSRVQIKTELEAPYFVQANRARVAASAIRSRRRSETRVRCVPVLLRSLELLRELRLAADRRDVTTRHDNLALLRSAVSAATPSRVSAI